MPSATDNPTMASIMATTSTPSPAKMCKRWGLLCPFSAQSTPHPSPIDSDWSEEGWDREIEKQKRNKEKEMKWRQKEEMKILDPNYYLPEPIYVPFHEQQPPTYVNDLIPAQEKSRDMKQNDGKSKTEE